MKKFLLSFALSLLTVGLSAQRVELNIFYVINVQIINEKGQ